MKAKFTIIYCVLVFSVFSQTGPNNPATTANNTSIGSNAWATPGNIVSSNNSYATCTTKGLTNYVVGTNFGFAIPSPVNVDGIVVEIEKSTSAPASVALLNAWTVGLTKTITAGTNRCLIVVVGIENGIGFRDVTGMTYGGQAMTQIGEFSNGSGAAFTGRVEAWILLEAGIAAASSTTIVPTYGAYTNNQYCEVFSSATFQNVDQLIAVSSLATSGVNGATDPHQLGTAITTLDGSMAVNAVMCGNNTTAASTVGAATSYTINSGYTEGTDYYFSNTGFSTSGGCLQTAHKAIATGGTEQPTCDFRGTVNRHCMIGFTLQRARETDVEVRIVKGGAIVGSNLAATPFWTTTDTYTTYGGSTTLWGTTWTLTDINNAGFGAAIAARVQNGTARVDHMRITVYTTSTLPIELLDFDAQAANDCVNLNWITASELNNDHFEIERSSDGVHFEKILMHDGAGNSSSVLYYTMKDRDPIIGISYYRLKQVDFDGQFSYSDVRSVNFENSNYQVYPNPASEGNITIYTHNIGVNEVCVYSSDLKLVKIAQFDSEENPIVNIEDMPAGTYFLMIKDENSNTRVIKVMKVSIEK